MNTNVRSKISRSTLMERLEVNGAVIEYQVQGDGEPVLLIPPGLVIDGLGRPLLAAPELASHYQLIHYHRRGYMGSTLGSQPLTIALAASDVAVLLRHLAVKAVHIAGHSIGGLIAMQLAVDAPELVHSIALLEAPMPMIPGGKASLESTFVPMLNAYRSGNKRQAVKTFSDNVFGPGWESVVEEAVPGSVEQAVKDMDTFIQELPSIPAWQFGAAEIAKIRQPVLSVLGIHSHPFMKDGRALLHAWFPQTEDLDVDSTHLLQMRDPQGVAHGLAEFFSRHPILPVH